MAPNKRADNKKVFSVSFEKSLVAEIAAICEKLGIDRNKFIAEAAAEKLKKERESNTNQK